MVVLCDGMMRSGSTWSYNVALRLLTACQRDRKTFGLYHDNPAVLAAAVRPRDSNVVIKSHILDPSVREWCRTGAIKAIYTWRDPYDVVVSITRMTGVSVGKATGLLKDALRVWSFHQDTDSGCIISYETILTRPMAGISSIADYLGLSITAELLSEIANDVSFENVKRFSERVDELSPRRVVRSSGLVYDRHTLLHLNHIKNGDIGYGLSLLSEGEISAINTVLQEEGFESLVPNLELSDR